MPLPQYITARHSMPYLKGRIIDAPGMDGGIWMVDPQGKVLAKGFSLKIMGTHSTQPNPAAAPVEMATIHVTKARADGGRETYKIVQPVKRVMESFYEVLREGVGEDAEFDEKDSMDSLLLLVMAASDKEKQAFAPTYNTLQWTEANGWYSLGKLVCPMPVEISREVSTESGERLFVLRIPKENGYAYTTCSWEDLLAGRYVFSGRSLSVQDPINTAMAMLGRWNSLSEHDRQHQEYQERKQPELDAQAERERQFKMASPLYSAPHYRTRL